MDSLTLTPITRPFDGVITPPGSKSLTNRALVLAALARGTSTLRNVLFADDTAVMIDGLRQLGFELEVDEASSSIRVMGTSGRVPAGSARLMCGNSGTTIRFLTALCALGKGSYELDGIARMRQRPIGQLVEMLKNLGVRVEYLLENGFPPICIKADTLPGGRVRFGASLSSQYLSAVLQVAPYARHEVRVDLEPNQTSWPYVEMTMRLMDYFGVTPELVRDPVTGEPRQIIIPPDCYRACDYAIEPDASNASYFLAAAAINPGSRVTIPGLGRSSLQGDVAFAEVLKKMGAGVEISENSMVVQGADRLEGIDMDMSAIPDTAQTLAVVALFANGPTVLRGLHTLRVKETDRIAALANELSKLGAHVEAGKDRLTVHPPRQLTPAAIDTYDDHRMAMSFAVAGTRMTGVTINDPRCVEKTYPRFFDDLSRLVAMTCPR